MDSLLVVVFTLLGLFVGSFLNVCIDRLPKGESIAFPPSHCAACRHKLGFLYLIPLLSFLGLKGRCRYCGAAIPARIPLVEAVTGLLFGLLFLKYGLGAQLGILLVYTCLLIIIFVIDLETTYVMSVTVYPAMALAVAFSLFRPGIMPLGLLGSPAIDMLASSLLGGISGMAAMGLPYLIARFIYRREGMGKGDIQLGAMVGFMTGFPLVFVAWFLSVISGGIISGSLLLFKVKKRDDAIPFGPFIAAAALATLLWGKNILGWYLG